MNLSDNELVTLLLCSDMALNDGEKPISNAAYDSFARALYKEGKQPSDLYTMSEDEIFDIYQKHVTTIFKKCRTNDFHTRIPQLLKRHQQLLMQLSEFENQGIHVLTRANRSIYPQIIKQKLVKAETAIPAVIYYAGNLSLLETNKVLAVVGSRNLEKDPEAEPFTKEFVKRAVKDGFAIASGGAKGIDDFALQTAIEENGKFIIAVSDNMAKKIKEPNVRKALMNNEALYLSLVNPNARFTGYNAMDRNKIIYASANYSIVVSCEYQTKEKKGKMVIDNNKGGTWVGANECYNKRLSRLLVRSNGESTSNGNKALLEIIDSLEIENTCINTMNSFSEIIAEAENKLISKQQIKEQKAKADNFASTNSSKNNDTCSENGTINSSSSLEAIQMDMFV